MFMFPEPPPKNYRIRHANLNIISSEVFSPHGFPRCTQNNVGIYSFPLADGSGEFQVTKLNDTIIDRWTQQARAWWIGKPGEDAFAMFDMHQRTKDTREIDPRFMSHSSIFPRSYQYELDCMESRRHQKLLDKVARETREYDLLKEKRLQGEAKETVMEPCVCLESSEEEVKVEHSEEVDPGNWHPVPRLFAKSQDDPCKRRNEFQKFGQSFRTEACNFYYNNYPPPPLSKHLQKFAL